MLLTSPVKVMHVQGAEKRAREINKEKKGEEKCSGKGSGWGTSKESSM